MVVSLLQINSLIRYHRNFRQLRLFGIGYPLFFLDCECIQAEHLLEPISKSHQELILTRVGLHHPSQLLPQLPVNNPLASSSNSPTFVFTDVPTKILSLLLLHLHFIWGDTYNNQEQNIS